jgi:hypothetical protein
LGTTDAAEGETAGVELVVPADAGLEVESAEAEEPEVDEVAAVAAPWAFCAEVAPVPVLPPQPAQSIIDANANPKIIVRIFVLVIQDLQWGFRMNRGYRAVYFRGIGDCV